MRTQLDPHELAESRHRADYGLLLEKHPFLADSLKSWDEWLASEQMDAGREAKRWIATIEALGYDIVPRIMPDDVE